MVYPDMLNRLMQLLSLLPQQLQQQRMSQQTQQILTYPTPQLLPILQKLILQQPTQPPMQEPIKTTKIKMSMMISLSEVKICLKSLN